MPIAVDLILRSGYFWPRLEGGSLMVLPAMRSIVRTREDALLTMRVWDFVLQIASQLKTSAERSSL